MVASPPRDPVWQPMVGDKWRAPAGSIREVVAVNRRSVAYVVGVVPRKTVTRALFADLAGQWALVPRDAASCP